MRRELKGPRQWPWSVSRCVARVAGQLRPSRQLQLLLLLLFLLLWGSKTRRTGELIFARRCTSVLGTEFRNFCALLINADRWRRGFGVVWLNDNGVCTTCRRMASVRLFTRVHEAARTNPDWDYAPPGQHKHTGAPTTCTKQ